MFPSVLTAKRSAPLQEEWTGALATKPFSPMDASSPPSTEALGLGLLSRTVWVKDGGGPGPWCPSALDPALKPGRPSPSLHPCLSTRFHTHVPLSTHTLGPPARGGGGAGLQEPQGAKGRGRRAAGNKAQAEAWPGELQGSLEHKGGGSLCTGAAYTHPCHSGASMCEGKRLPPTHTPTIST